jgi:hypothetical protein
VVGAEESVAWEGSRGSLALETKQTRLPVALQTLDLHDTLLPRFGVRKSQRTAPVDSFARLSSSILKACLIEDNKCLWELPSLVYLRRPLPVVSCSLRRESEPHFRSGATCISGARTLPLGPALTLVLSPAYPISRRPNRCPFPRPRLKNSNRNRTDSLSRKKKKCAFHTPQVSEHFNPLQSWKEKIFPLYWINTNETASMGSRL